MYFQIDIKDLKNNRETVKFINRLYKVHLTVFVFN